MRTWVVSLFVLASLAGCAEADPPADPMGSGEAIATAQAAIEQSHPDAFLSRVSTDWGSLTDDAVEWHHVRDFDPAAYGGSPIDGTNHAWLVYFLVPSDDEDRLPGSLVVQVTPMGARTVFEPGRQLVGDSGGGPHHDPDDLCMQAEGSSVSAAELDLLHDMVDSTEVVRHLREDIRITAFLPDADSVHLDLVGARSSYGNAAYWCWQPRQAWTFAAQADNGTAFWADFTMSGAPVGSVDWTHQPPAFYDSETRWEHTDELLDTNDRQTHELHFDVPAESMWMHATAITDPAPQAADVEIVLLDPAGDPARNRWEDDAGWAPHGNFFAEYPEAGRWTLVYSYTAGPPVDEHEVDLSVGWYGLE